MLVLNEFPTEIILQVIKFLESARDIARFSLVCKRLHNLTIKDGYRTFAQAAFPTISIPAPVEYAGDTGIFFRDATRSLTTLSKNWDRKALLTYPALPLPHGQRHAYVGLGRQTMSFVPVIDSLETWYGTFISESFLPVLKDMTLKIHPRIMMLTRKLTAGGDWTDRYQVVACGTGARLCLRTTDLAKPSYPESRADRPLESQLKWNVYDEKGCFEGRDDIVAIKLIKPTVKCRQDIIVGRANGDVAVISYYSNKHRFKRIAKFSTESLPVKSLTLNDHGLLAVCLSNQYIALYDIAEDFRNSQPIQRLYLDPSQQSSGTFPLQWLCNDRLAFGNGTKSSPVEFFEYGTGARTQLSRIPEMTPKPAMGPQSRSDYGGAISSLASLPSSSLVGQRPGDVFLSGCYDGAVRLHDLRCATSVVSTFEDHIDSSAIYSLMTYGQERVVAGAASFSLLKIFDLRITGARQYYSTKIQNSSQSASGNTHRSNKDDRKIFQGRSSDQPKDWNLFLSNIGSRGNSPVYSLSKPSEFSPMFFAGIEGRVVQVDLVSIIDGFPDPVFSRMINSGDRAQDVRLKWGSRSHVFRLAMYDHPGNTHKTVHLRKQRPLGYYNYIYGGIDERWEPT